MRVSDSTAEGCRLLFTVLSIRFRHPRQASPPHPFEEGFRNSGRNPKGHLLLLSVSEYLGQCFSARDASSEAAGAGFAPSDSGIEFLIPLNMDAEGMSARAAGIRSAGL